MPIPPIRPARARSEQLAPDEPASQRARLNDTASSRASNARPATPPRDEPTHASGLRPRHEGAAAQVAHAAPGPRAALPSQPSARTGATSTSNVRTDSEATVSDDAKSHHLDRPSAEQMAAATARIAAKRTPDASKRGMGDIAWNCEVKLPEERPDSHGDTTVECRHFATVWARHVGKKAELLDRFWSDERITRCFTGRLHAVNDDFDRIVSQAPQAARHLVRGDQLGTYMAAVAQALWASTAQGGPNEANMLLLTHDHAMALHMQKKSDNGVDYFSAKLFDPCSTATHMRMEALSLDDLAGVSLADMLVDPDSAARYASKDHPLALVAIGLDERVSPAIGQLHCSPLDRPGAQPTPADLHAALDGGLAHAIPSLCAATQPPASSAAAALLARLQAVVDDGNTGLYKAIANGQDHAIEAFGAAVARSGLSRAEQVAVFQGSDLQHKQSALLKAVMYGTAQGVPAFGRALVAAGLSDEQKLHTLAGKHSSASAQLGTLLSRVDAQQAAHLNTFFAAAQIEPATSLALLQTVGSNPSLEHAARDRLRGVIEGELRRL